MAAFAPNGSVWQAVEMFGLYQAMQPAPQAQFAARNRVRGPYPAGMGAFEDVGGHHPLSGKAFDYAGYDEAMSIGKEWMRSKGWGHPQPLTEFQRQGYQAFAQTREPLSIYRMSAIEVDAIIKSGIPSKYARQAVSAAIWERFANGDFTPSCIPWNGPNPGASR